jgi:hypothetical protein
MHRLVGAPRRLARTVDRLVLQLVELKAQAAQLVFQAHAWSNASSPIPAECKELVWLGSQNQLQFYEDPITIDQTVPHVVRFFDGAAR